VIADEHLWSDSVWSENPIFRPLHAGMDTASHLRWSSTAPAGRGGGPFRYNEREYGVGGIIPVISGRGAPLARERVTRGF
jgi:hypothetical protein